MVKKVPMKKKALAEEDSNMTLRNGSNLIISDYVKKHLLNINNHLQESSLFINNLNKGYHSDGYLNEQKKLQQYNSLINIHKKWKYLNLK